MWHYGYCSVPGWAWNPTTYGWSASRARPAVVRTAGPRPTAGCTSLSHSRDLSLLAFAAVPLGVDVEAVPASEAAAEIGAMLHPAESRELAALPASDRPAAFTRAWTRKEAYLKGEGIGLARDLSLDHLGTGPVPRPGPAGWTVADVLVPAGYAAAVAVRAAGRPPVADGHRRK